MGQGRLGTRIIDAWNWKLLLVECVHCQWLESPIRKQDSLSVTLVEINGETVPAPPNTPEDLTSFDLTPAVNSGRSQSDSTGSSWQTSGICIHVLLREPHVFHDKIAMTWLISYICCEKEVKCSGDSTQEVTKIDSPGFSCSLLRNLKTWRCLKLLTQPPHISW